MSTENRYSIIILMTVVLLLTVGLFCLNWYENKITNECIHRFGQQWQGRYSYYGPEICVNSDGGVKYL